MDSKITQEKRDELRRLYFESAQINIRKKKIEDELLDLEEVTGKREKVARRRKGELDPSLPITTIALLSGFSRDKVYRLLLAGILPDRHPVSVGKLIRAGYGFREIPRRHQDEYQSWKTTFSGKRGRKRYEVGRCVQVRTAK